MLPILNAIFKWQVPKAADDRVTKMAAPKSHGRVIRVRVKPG